MGVPPTQITVEKDTEIKYRPLSAVDMNSPIIFMLTTSTDEYLKLDTLQLFWQFQIHLEKDDKTKAITRDDWKNVEICNYTQHAMIKQIDIDINGKQIFNLPQNYPYRAYIEALLGYTDDAKKSHLSSSLWMTDDERKLIIAPIGLDISKSRKIDMFGKIHTDLSYQGRALIGGTQLKLQIALNEPKFYLKIASG